MRFRAQQLYIRAVRLFKGLWGLGLRVYAFEVSGVAKLCGFGRAGAAWVIGVRIRGTFGDIDPLNTVPFKRATSRVQKGPLSGVSLILPRR